MDGKKLPKKAMKKKRLSNSQCEVDSDESDHEITAFNGMDDSMDGHSDGGWDTDDDRELVEKVKQVAKNYDKVNYKTRLKQIDWNEIAFKSYSPVECEQRFSEQLKRVRRYRNLSEIAADIEANIKKCPVKKPLNSYQLFVQEQLINVKSSGDFSETMKNVANLYKELSPTERAVYERKAVELRNEYKIKRIEFESGKTPQAAKNATPAVTKSKTPFMLYMESKSNEECDIKKLKESYSNLSLEEKYKWVIKAVSDASSEQVITDLLNKEEQRILNGQAKSTPTAYSLFVKETYQKIREDDVQSLEFGDKKGKMFTEIASRWKSLDTKTKKLYMDAAALLKEKAKKEQLSFNERHGVTPRKQRRKSVFVERAPVSEDEDEVPTPKKRKVSATFAESSSDEATKHIQYKLPSKKSVKSPKKAVNGSPNKPISESPRKEIPSSPEKSVVKKLALDSPRKVKPMEVEEEVDEEIDGVDDAPAEIPADKQDEIEKSELSENNDRSESDAGLSSSSTGSKKKKSKKNKKSKVVEPPADKPPSTLIKYFAKFVHTGKPHKVQKAFDKLDKKTRKRLNAEYNEKVEVYVVHLKKYLASLSKEDAVSYISKIKAADEAEMDEADNGNVSSQEY